jgi:hypothetical protein
VIIIFNNILKIIIMASESSNTRESDLVRTFFAGIASICAASVTHPIDTVKTRL